MALPSKRPTVDTYRKIDYVRGVVKKKATSLRLSQEAHRILQALAAKWRISMSAALEIGLAKLAEKELEER